MAKDWRQQRLDLPTQQAWILKHDRMRLQVLGNREHRSYRQQLTAVIDFYCHERGLDMDTARVPGEEPDPAIKNDYPDEESPENDSS